VSTPNGTDAEQQTEQQTKDQQTKDQLMSRAYSASQRRLREAHSDEFNSFMAEETSKLGLSWKPRQSPEEKALSEVLSLLDANPGLADKLAAKLANQS
jgi:hypothetical protein